MSTSPSPPLKQGVNENWMASAQKVKCAFCKLEARRVDAIMARRGRNPIAPAADFS
jgi:hypothetical protein